MLNPDAIKSNTGAPVVSYSDSVVIDSVPLPPSSTPTPAPTTPVASPLPPAPTAPAKKTGKHTVSHPHKPVATISSQLKKMVRQALTHTSRSPVLPEKGSKK